MEYVFLGRTGVRVSKLAFGTMSFGGEVGEQMAATMFERCRAAGINLFDCANLYHQGRAEEILGRLIGRARDEVVLTTKAYFPTGPGPNDRGSSRYHLRNAVEASLRRLGTDHVDLFFLHRMDDHTPLEETLREVERMVTDGKILYPAVSNFAAWQTARALGIAERHGWAPVCCVQPMYNLLKRQAEVEILPLCAAEGLACLSYGPLAGGLLSGKYGTQRRPEQGRIVDNPMYGVRYGAASNFEIAERFVTLAQEHGLHPAALAIAWVAAHPAVTAPLLGARSLEQLDVCLGAAELEPSEELYAAISALSPEPPRATDRSEETSIHNYGTR
ncbi:aldo/keto reductase [Paraliomyxa miuraensis]|uniref:aldo/keto reductase n=1 Tax=Paraliomyxa miuraensis TaxID=376150 RepID=UPI00225658B1|nr:aldo/keto reductase [Paraliomyxa miuraensis]MCX4246758.1 aldo/keto reductase [Paraliomyxa miuraensis]